MWYLAVLVLESCKVCFCMLLESPTAFFLVEINSIFKVEIYSPAAFLMHNYGYAVVLVLQVKWNVFCSSSKLCFYAGLRHANMLVLGLRAISSVSGQELDCLRMRNLLLKKIWRSIASQSSSTILFNGEPLKM